MKAIIAGAGRTGLELAKRLTLDHHDVVVLEKDSEKILQISDQLDVFVIKDTGERFSALTDAGIKDADVFIAVTDSDELNIMYCLIAKKLSDIKTVARVRNPEYVSHNMVASSGQLGIDIMIDPEGLTAYEIAKLIKTPGANAIEYFAGGKIEVLSFKIEGDSELVDKPLKSLPASGNFLIIGICREDGDVIIPKGDDHIFSNDEIFVVKKPGTLSEIGSMVRSDKKKARSVMILGGGKVAFRLAKTLEGYGRGGHTVKLVEKSAEKCRILSEHLDKTLILNGDATDINFLKDENIENTDMMVALTGSDEMNIITCLLAKKLGVGKTIAEVNNPDYEVITETLGIDSYVSSRLLVAGSMMKLFRRPNILSETVLKDGKAEMSEIIVSPKAPVINKKLTDIKLSSKGIIIGGIIRGEKAIIPKGNDTVLPGDHLIIFTKGDKNAQVEKLFSENKTNLLKGLFQA